VRKGNGCRRALVSYVINGINVTANKKKKKKNRFGIWRVSKDCYSTTCLVLPFGQNQIWRMWGNPNHRVKFMVKRKRKGRLTFEWRECH
jgi:hypothetical protein